MNLRLTKTVVDFFCAKRLSYKQRRFPPASRLFKFLQIAFSKVMNNSETQNSSRNKTADFKLNHFSLAVFSLGALIITFFAASSDLGFGTKIAIFLSVVSFYLICCARAYVLQKRRLSDSFIDANAEISESVFGGEIEMKLLALEEASEFFGASLKSADMFRLVASRIKEIIPFTSVALFLTDEDKTRLKATFADGENAESLAHLDVSCDKNLNEKALLSRKSQIGEGQLFGKSAISAEITKNLNSVVSVPLRRGAEIFGVLALYGKNAEDFDDNSLILLEAVGERVTPLFLSSFAFEKNLVNALTDSLTNLPNERAFYLIAENKIAESQRFRESRPLSILTVDIKNFSELNQKYGHATGDRVLAFAAKTIKEQLREMDFLARSSGDEFLAVLPTADKETTKEIVGRIEKAFSVNPFVVSRREKINLVLNFGAATFWKDGETISQLLQHAQVRKQQSKSTEKSKVLWFPKEFVN